VQVSLSSQLESTVRSYLSGTTSLEQLQAWLDAHVQETADSNEPAAIELSDRIWILLAEHGYGERTEDDVRAELNRSIPLRAR
jgi:hypothetical protein